MSELSFAVHSQNPVGPESIRVADLGLSCAEPRPGGCGRRRLPGRGESGCAFQGAKRALQPIVDALHLVHGPASCEGASWLARPTASSGSHLHRQSFTTACTEREVAQGGEGKLLKAIGEIIERHDPPAVFVYQTCLPAMIGDDVAAVCRVAERRWRRPVIAVETPGFAGNRVYGGHVAMRTLRQRVIGTREPAQRTATDINVIGEFNVAGELERVRPLLGALGIRVLSTIPGDGRFNDIAAAHRARATLLICAEGSPGLAQAMRDDLGIPFIEGSFYGSAGTSATLRRLARLLAGLGAPRDLPDRTEALIAREEARIAAPLAGYRRRLTGKRVMLMSVGAKAHALAEVLEAAGMELVGAAVGAVGAAGADGQRTGAECGAPAPTGERTIEAIDGFLRQGGADIVVGGGNRQFLALKARVPWVEVNHDRTFPLTGYAGELAFLRAIDATLVNPVWQQVRGPAPWQAAPIQERPSRLP